MSKVSDMWMDEHDAAGDELRCEIDHWKARADEAERLLERAREQIAADNDLLGRMLDDEVLVSHSYQAEAGVQEAYGSETEKMIRAFLDREGGQN